MHSRDHRFAALSTLQRLINSATKEKGYSAYAYLKPGKKRPNFNLVTEAHVEKITLDKESGEVIAKCVKVIVEGIEHNFRVGKEVIFAACALSSAKILEIPGFCHPELPCSAGIDVCAANANVGENSQVHTSSEMSFEVVDEIPNIDCL